MAHPEETHTGRQAHHSRREVFLTNTDENCVDSPSAAAVLLLQQYRDATRLANEPRRLLGEKHERQRLRRTAAEPATGVVEPDDKERTKTRHLPRRRLRG